MASIYANLLEQKKVFAFEKSSTPRGLVWNTNMAAVSLFWNTNMAAVTSQLKPGGNSLIWPIRGCAAGQGMVFDLSALNGV